MKGTRVAARLAALGVILTGATAGATIGTAAGAATSAAGQSTAAESARSVPRNVVLIGIPGLRWTDLSPGATPELWRMARAGSVGNLVVHAISSVACPADGWLTLNAGARAGLPRHAEGRCPGLPLVVPAGSAAPAGSPASAGQSGRTGTEPTAAKIPRMASLISVNSRFHYGPDWGLLRSAAGAGRCAMAIGPGAGLALADASGRVTDYLSSVFRAGPPTLAACPLTVVDLGAVPPPAAPGGAAARAADVRSDDQQLGRLRGMLPPDTIVVVAALADDGSPHLRPLIVSGPGYPAGSLGSESTRQPGLSQLTDITPAVLGWRGLPVPAGVVGSGLTRSGRGSLATEISDLIGQDTAAQVYRTTFGWFFAIFAVAEAVVFGAIAWLLRGREQEQRRKRRRAARAAGIAAGSIPAGTFLASLVPWWTVSHPTAALYGLAAAWATVIAAIALAGPWRRVPLGPAGVVGAITLAVVGIDLITGSRLQLNTPFGLNVLWGGRFYGEDNNTVGIFGVSAILCAAWLGAAGLGAVPPRSGSPGRSQSVGSRRPRARAVLAVSAVAGFAVVASAWPGFGAKVGGTIAMVPGLVLLIMAVADVKITPRRAALAAVSGVVVIAAFAVVSYLLPATGHSDVGAFAGQALHGGGGNTLQRKISTMLGSYTGTPFSWIIPLALAAFGVLLLRPAWFGAGALTRARQAVPLLGISLVAIWVLAILAGFAEDSGVGAPGAMLPLALPLVIAIVSSAPAGSGTAAAGDPSGHDVDVPARAE